MTLFVDVLLPGHDAQGHTGFPVKTNQARFTSVPLWPASRMHLVSAAQSENDVILPYQCARSVCRAILTLNLRRDSWVKFTSFVQINMG